MKNYRNRIGISLLELMLSLAIISILLVTATRYYVTTRSAQQINDALQIIQNMTTAADNWYWTYKSYNDPDHTISLSELVKMGLLPDRFLLTNSNPWGGSLNITPKDTNHVSIQLKGVPSADCLNLKGILEPQNKLIGTCSTADGTFTLIYPQ